MSREKLGIETHLAGLLSFIRVTNPPVGQNPSPQRKRAIQEKHRHIQGRGLISSLALGLTDGLVTNVAFLAGFAGANYGVNVIRFAGLAAMLAGAVSMFFSGFLAARSEKELYQADASREAEEIEQEPEEERQELKSFYMQKGLSAAEADMVVNRIASDKKVWLQDLLTHELHVHEEKLESPVRVGLTVGLAFLVGAFVPLSIYFLPFARLSLISVSIICSLIFLFLAGSWKGKIVKRDVWLNGLEMMLVGALAFVLLYFIGTLLVFV